MACGQGDNDKVRKAMNEDLRQELDLNHEPTNIANFNFHHFNGSLITFWTSLISILLFAHLASLRVLSFDNLIGQNFQELSA